MCTLLQKCYRALCSDVTICKRGTMVLATLIHFLPTLCMHIMYERVMLHFVSRSFLSWWIEIERPVRYLFNKETYSLVLAYTKTGTPL